MWARAPETEGVSCGLGDSVADRLCRDPSLRGLTPPVLARHLGVSLGAAEAGIRRIAEMATGRDVRSFGLSLDATLGAKGRPAPKVAIEYAPDAQGGFATPSQIGLLPPGSTDPRVRSFTKAILDPGLVAQYGEAAVKRIGVAGLVPPPEDLDRVALFVPPPLDWPGQLYQWLDTTPDGRAPDGSFREPTWADVQRAGTAIGRPDLDAVAVRSSLNWWRYAYAIGPLPEDEQGVETDSRSSSYNWPHSGIDPNMFRKIYFWGFGKDGKLYKHMQLQKGDGFGNFKVFNQYGQNLTFVLKPDGKWIAGWDLGDWFVQNKVAIVKGLQLGLTAVIACLPFASAAVAALASALFGITSFGLSLGVTGAISSAVAAQQAFIAGCIAIAKGDLGAAFKYFAEMGTDLGQVPITGDAKEIVKSFNEIVSQSGVKALAQVVAEAGTGDLTALVSKAAILGGTALQVGQKEIYETRALIPTELRPWFDQAVKEGGAAVGRNVPWYAQGTHMLGVVMGTLQDPYTAGIHAPRGIAPKATKPLDQMTLAELQQTLAESQANYDRVSQTLYGKTHPAFLAVYAEKIAEIQVAIDVKKNPRIISQKGDPRFTMTVAQALAAAPTTPTKPASPTSPAGASSPAAPVVAGGLLALLFFL